MFAKVISTASKRIFSSPIASRTIQHTALNADFTPIQISVPWGKVEGK